MSHQPMSYPDLVESLRPKFETLELVDRLIEENLALKRELNLKTGRLRALQRAVHGFLIAPDTDSQQRLLAEAEQEKP